MSFPQMMMAVLCMGHDSEAQELMDNAESAAGRAVILGMSYGLQGMTYEKFIEEMNKQKPPGLVINPGSQAEARLELSRAAAKVGWMRGAEIHKESSKASQTPKGGADLN